MTTGRIDWSAVTHAFATLPLQDALAATRVAAFPTAVEVDAWLWDQQRRSLQSATKPRVAIPLADVGDRVKLATHASPLVLHGDHLGYLIVDAGDDHGHDVDATALDVLAPLVAMAIRAISPITDLIETTRRTRTMSLQAELQWAMLPPDTLTRGQAFLTAGVEPAYDTGGDVFDYDHRTDRLFLGVLDARGHGLLAASTNAVATSAMRRARRAGGDLLAIAADIDAAVLALGDAGNFVSAVLAEIDLQTWEGVWLSAGHSAPLIVDQDGTIEQLEATPALPLGLRIGGHASEPRLQPLVVEESQHLVLYSDGIVDNATSTPQSSTGEARFHDALRHHTAAAGSDQISHTARSVIEELIAVSGPHLRDDATLVVVRHGYG